MLKRLYAINFIDAFIAGATTVLVPLLMLDRGIDIAAIGLVFAAAPLAKAVVRLAGAAIADSLGDRIIYVFASVSNLLETLAYFLSTAPAGFAAGKLLDGARESFLWSGVRPSLMAVSPEKKHFAFADLLSGRLVYNAIGSLAVGFLFFYGGYGLPLLSLVCLSAYLVLSSLGMKNLHKAKAGSRLADFNPLGRSNMFYEIAGAFALGSAMYTAVFYMLLPLYFKLQGFSLGEIGLFYAGYFLIIGCTLRFLSHSRVGTRKAAAAGAVLYCAGLAGVALAPHGLIPLFFLLMAFGDANLALLWEEMNYVAAKRSSKRATDLALLVVPSLLAVMVASGVSGAAAGIAGFAPLFFLLALSEIGFAAWCVRLGGQADK